MKRGSRYHLKQTTRDAYDSRRPMETVLCDIAKDWMTSRMIYARYRRRGGSHSKPRVQTVLCIMRATGLIERRCKPLRTVRKTQKCGGYGTHTWEFRTKKGPI